MWFRMTLSHNLKWMLVAYCCRCSYGRGYVVSDDVVPQLQFEVDSGRLPLPMLVRREAMWFRMTLSHNFNL